MVELKDDSDFKAGEFKGRVENSLKTICSNITEIKRDMKAIRGEVRTEMKSMNDKINNNRLKIAGIGATISFVVTILILLMKELMAK